MVETGEETTKLDLRTVEERIINSIQDERLRALFAGERAELTPGELALIDARHENDLRVLEVVKGMSRLDFAFCGTYQPLHIEHYGAIERVDWIKPHLFFLGERLKRKPETKEIIADVKKSGIEYRFHAYYVMSYEDLVSREGDAGLMSNFTIGDLKERGKRTALSASERELVDLRFEKDKMILARIKAMKPEEFLECDKYAADDYDHYMQIQRFDWMRTEAYLLGKALQHEPSEMEIVMDAVKSKNWPRYRAWYDFMYPKLVKRAA